jgi:peptidoglycan/LPS O-acetylase OafA/YrhL
MVLLAAVSSLVLRLRRSRGDERQQIKWIVYAAAYFALTLALVFYGGTRSDGTILQVGTVLHVLSLVGLLAAMTIAIFKYRLYEIDIIINKTLVYGALSGTLALVYFSSVVLLQQVFPADSQISIVLSTMAIAGLFAPLRRRIQKAIDKRFYRRKYDAQQTLAAFSVRMRDEVELERLSETLLAVVDETMQPAHVSLWFKEGKLRASGQRMWAAKDAA